MLRAIAGNVDEMDGQHATGWVADLKSTDVRLEVTAYVEGRCIGTGRADIFREDLVRAGYGDGCYGFHFPVRDAGCPSPDDLSFAVVVPRSSKWRLWHPPIFLPLTLAARKQIWQRAEFARLATAAPFGEIFARVETGHWDGCLTSDGDTLRADVMSALFGTDNFKKALLAFKAMHPGGRPDVTDV